MSKKIPVNVELGDEVFLVTGITIKHNVPGFFFIDFKQAKEVTDNVFGETRTAIQIKRRTIAINAVLIKDFIRILNHALNKYEKFYGNIKMPEIPKKFKIKPKSKEITISSENYIG